MEIKWTDEAKETFKSNIRYLLEEWTHKEVVNFTHEVYKKLDLLAKYPDLGSYDDELKCNRYFVVKQITLFYMVQFDEIVLLSFWNNYKKPLKRLQ
ncbi:plasmid stabilization system protein ParE [Pedobacter sp. UYP30]|uniref:type II toxin-antitoxin system RelE/ParE family toxin n=1 Tax=Pedobacter sp. UYP30 TaxID=1756400 RepID=UPI0033956A64